MSHGCASCNHGMASGEMQGDESVDGESMPDDPAVSSTRTQQPHKASRRSTNDYQR